MVIAGDVLLVLALLYLLIGCGYALRFVVRVLDRVNDRARLSGPFFRISVVPAAVLLWPWLQYLDRRGDLNSHAQVEAGEPK